MLPSKEETLAKVLANAPSALWPSAKKLAVVAVLLLVAGVVLGAISGGGFVAWWVPTTLIAGLASCGVVFSAIFQLTGARWGRAYRRLAEAMVALMPLSLAAVVVLLIGGAWSLPWSHAEHLTGGKAIWLTRGFWDLRVLASLACAYGVSLWFVYYSVRRDFCQNGLPDRFKGRIARWLCQGIVDPLHESERCEQRLSVLAPVVLIVFALCFSLLGFDLIMALEPNWYSTLFGAWYFVGVLFIGLALLALIGIAARRAFGLADVLTVARQSDLATLLFAFCLIHIDFFWSQFLTIWYANIPEETEYLIRRTIDEQAPWPTLSWIALAAFFVLPLCALLARKVKQQSALLAAVATFVIVGVFLARFIEVAPPLLTQGVPLTLTDLASPLAAAVLVFLGMLGLGAVAWLGVLSQVPLLPIGDPLLFDSLPAGDAGHEGAHS